MLVEPSQHINAIDMYVPERTSTSISVVSQIGWIDEGM